MAEHIRALLSYGVLAVRDGGDHLAHVFRYKNEFKAGEDIKNPLILKATTQVWYRKGRYGSFLGRAVIEEAKLSTEAAKETYSADHIKLINSGPNSITTFGEETVAQFSFAEIEDLARQIQNRKQKLI